MKNKLKHTLIRTLTLSLTFLMIASVLVFTGCKATAGSDAQSNTDAAAVETISDYTVPLAAPQSDTSEAFDSTPVRGAAPIAHPPVARERATEAPNP